LSIGLLASANNLVLPIWFIWTGISLLLLFVVAGRSGEASPREPESTGVVFFLAPVGVGLFVVWVMVSAFWNEMAVKSGVSTMTGEHKALLAVIAPLVPATLGLMVLRGRTAREAIGLSVDRIRPGVLWGLLGITIALPVVWWSLEASMQLWKWIGYEHDSKHVLLTELGRHPAMWVRVAIVLAAVVVTPIFEELLFRGLLQTSLRRVSGSPVAAIFLTSLVFAVIHDAWSAPAIFVLSVGIGACYELSRNLLAAIVMHAAFNAFAIATSGAL